jgi:CubicO group peptidase (beta-lactamase class C family)
MIRSPAICFAAVALCAMPLASQSSLPDRGALLRRIDSVVTAEMSKNHNVGVSVGIELGDEVLLAKGYGFADLEHSVPALAETVYRIGSITKQFTAVAIMQLVEQGKLRLDDELVRFVPDFKTYGHRVTVHHLLTHTSGIKSYTSIGPRFWNEASRLDLTHDQMLALFRDEPFDFAPGTKYLYNNSGYYLLGMIIEQVSGMPFPRYLEEKVLAPLGLAATSYCDNDRLIPHRAAGYEVREGTVVNDGLISMNTPGAAGAMCSTVLDLLAWQRSFNQARLIAPASRDRMRTSQIAVNDSSGYGYGLGISQLAGRPQVAHSGGINGFNSYLTWLRREDLTVVVLTNNGGGRAPQLGSLIARQVLDSVRDHP